MSDDDDVVEVVARLVRKTGYWKSVGRVDFGVGPEGFEDGDGDQWPFWILDGEALADGDVQDVVTEMTDALSRLGISLVVETIAETTPGSDRYAITINGEVVELYRLDGDTPLCEDPWRECTVKPLAALNRLLASTPTTYRFGVIPLATAERLPCCSQPTFSTRSLSTKPSPKPTSLSPERVAALRGSEPWVRLGDRRLCAR